MQKLNQNKVGLTFGALLGLWHAVWALLVALGVAKSFMDWILSLHFIELSYSVGSFTWGTALLLIVVTAVFGYIIGWVLAALWNSLAK